MLLQVRKLIVSECRKGLSYRTIAKKYSVSKSAVHKIYKKFLLHGIVENLRRSGRKRRTTIQEDRRIAAKNGEIQQPRHETFKKW